MQNPEPSDRHLTVYRASAGSGKTHQLTSEYLKLLYSSPFAYRHILAVTFTNKATDEMKSRIVVELSKLASGKDSGHTQTLIDFYHKDEQWVREHARSVLLKILHDYSAFSISTIDRFFQQTMRAFTRELGLTGGYNVELDSSKVLKESIDSMLYDLEKQNDSQLLEWLIRFSEEKIEKGDTWNIRSDIQSLAQEIFKEEFKTHSDDVQEDIKNKALLDDYKKQLEEIIYKFRKTSQSIGEKALNIMLRHDLQPSDFKGGSKSSFFSFRRWAEGEIKPPTKTFLGLPDEVDSWYIKTTESFIKDRIQEAFNDGLNDAVHDVIAHYDDTLLYNTALEINRYFFTLGILGDVDRKVREYTAEHNVMLISDTTELLRKIISDDETPFVYEKVGTRVDNYMIDEFQDTSGMQWSNFRPLIKNSMASGDKNLIVGDVKQSIYRWRNSDWNLLDEQLDVDFKDEGLINQTLATNWRSAKNIVKFNNTIFSMGSRLLQSFFNNSLPETNDNDRLSGFTSKIERAYRDVCQVLPEGRDVMEGKVQIDFIGTDEDSDWQNESLERLPHIIENLQEEGYSLRDIAILVRTKREGTEVAEALLAYKRENRDSKYRYDIISDEALYLGNAQIVKLIVSLMKHLRNSGDSSLKALAVYEYFRFKEQLSSEEALNTHFSVDYDFPDGVAAILTKAQELPVYEMTEELFALFDEVSSREDNIYIQSFLDVVLDFSANNSSDLDSFLQWWEETGFKKNIFTPDSQDAIRIMTIHKSKGLEFKVTIIPFCSWDIDNRLERILWCQPHIAPFDRLHLVPVRYGANLNNTIFQYEYFKERLHTFIDNLNVLYVAFTRPKEQLIAIAPKPKERGKESGEIRSISALLWTIINNQSSGDDSILNLSESLSEETNRLEIGTAVEQKPQGRIETESSQLNIESLPSIPFESRLKLRMNNKYFFAPDGSREYGNLMHEIVSKIETVDDLDSVLGDYSLSGDISTEERSKIHSQLLGFIENPLVRDWYSKEYKVLNEIQILLPNGTFVRPDRIMIKGDQAIVVDYKFGEKESSKYNKQVKSYVDYIRKIGYKNVSGFIFYVVLDKVVEV